jgi:hypothetical protein
MVTLTPSAGYECCRYHIMDRSPALQPTRQRNVFTPARLHALRDCQNRTSVIDSEVEVDGEDDGDDDGDDDIARRATDAVPPTETPADDRLRCFRAAVP